MDSRAIGIAAALGSAAAWAFGTILLKPVADGVASSAMTLVKGLVSVALLGAAVLAAGATPVSRSDLALLAASGVLGIAVGDICFFEALKELGAVPLVVLTTAGLVATPLLAAVFLGETGGGARWAGVALVAAGVATALSVPLSGAGRRHGLRGVAFGAAAVACMAISTLAAKRGLEGVSAIQGTLVRVAAGTAGLLAVAAATGRVGAWTSPFRDARVLGRLALAVAVVTFGGFFLSVAALQRLDVAIASTLGATEPVFAIPIAALLLKERATFRGVGGALVASAGVVLLCRT